MTIKRFFAGEHTTLTSREHGHLPARECEHAHRTLDTADRCAAKNYPWITYAELDTGRVVPADDVRFGH